MDSKKGSNKGPNRRGTGGFVVPLIIIGIFILFGFLMFGSSRVFSSNSKYYEVLNYYQKGEVAESTLEFTTGNLRYSLKENPDKVYNYKVPSVKMFLEAVDRIIFNKNESDLSKSGEVINYVRGRDFSWVLSVAPSVLTIAIMVMWFVFMLKFPGGGAGRIGQFGKSSFKKGLKGTKKTLFSDVAGADEEKEELAEVVEFLKNPKKFIDIGARIPKGVLLVGPPGTGKTLLARAVAGEANVPFFSISGSDFVELYVGVGASRVRDLFEQAKKESPSIIFIDEIDAVGRHRGAGLGGGHDEREQTLNQLLVEMDGFGLNEGLIVIAATNRRDILDPALLRPGRFDRHVTVGYPDIKGREDILKVHAKGKQLGFDVDLSEIAKSTFGFSGADLENLLNEGALLAVKKGHKAITSIDLEEATIKVIMGPEKRSKIIYDDVLRLTAYHEAGHAVATYFCPTQDAVHSVSIIPRGDAGGYTLSLPNRDDDYVTKTKMEESMVVGLGGRVAEKLILGNISTGAYSDIKYVTSTAHNMVKQYGFSESMGPINYGSASGYLNREESVYSEATIAAIDEEIRKFVDKAYKRCEEILLKNLIYVKTVAELLLKKEKINGDEFVAVMTGKIGLADIEQMEEVGFIKRFSRKVVKSEKESNDVDEPGEVVVDGDKKSGDEEKENVDDGESKQ